MQELMEMWDSNIADFESGAITRQEFNARAYAVGAQMKALAHRESMQSDSMLRGHA